MPRIIIGIYVVVGVFNVISQLIDIPQIYAYSKPLLMPLLIYLVYRMADGNITLPRLLLVVALIFSWIGDLLLMGAGDNYFLGGLASFFAAQITYAVVLLKSNYSKPELRFIYLGPILVYGGTLLSNILPNAGPLGFPIVVYALGILTMLFLASTRHGHTNKMSFTLSLMGAILFVVSDSLIAIDRFVACSSTGDVWVMGTYVPAQLLLVLGILLHR